MHSSLRENSYFLEETSGTLKEDKFMNKKGRIYCNAGTGQLCIIYVHNYLAGPTTTHEPQIFHSNLSHQIVSPSHMESSWSSGSTKIKQQSIHVSVNKCSIETTIQF